MWGELKAGTRDQQPELDFLYPGTALYWWQTTARIILEMNHEHRSWYQMTFILTNIEALHLACQKSGS
uniref:AlNc14C18G1846 protein n=1 Tax=Albugo laibachii Nc14 TaxID=890382 RepID=F0W4M5_9STRA|nr:AlNc14C18G1846 [Albugo laibachii Nc14]|eukprot:CCA16059.1 AlNc14C18G1846 [Albugo laibachii Nc14]